MHLTRKRREILYNNLPEDFTIETIGGTYKDYYSLVIYVLEGEWVVVRDNEYHKWWVSPSETEFLPDGILVTDADIGPYTRLRDAVMVMKVFNSCNIIPEHYYKKRLELNNGRKDRRQTSC